MNIPGVPWAYFHAGDYMGGQTSLHWAVAKGLEIGPAISLIALRDADRIGEDPFSFVWGVGGLLDWRLDNWQVDIRGGYSPGLKSLHPDQGAWTALGEELQNVRGSFWRPLSAVVESWSRLRR